jgi:hypothetical protein
MVRIIVILLVAGGLGLAIGGIQRKMQSDVQEQFYLVGYQPKPESAGVSPKAAPAKADGVPVVEFPEGTKYSFETMKHGTKMSHKFPLRNVGTAPLKLEKAGSTCKCTVGEMDQSVIMPGQTTTINLEWQGVAVGSNFAQSATFKTNSLETREFKLEVEGAVIDSFVIEPDQINLGSFASDVGTSREFSVYCYTEGVDHEGAEWSDQEKSKFFKLSSTPFSPADSEGHTKALKAHKVKLEVLPGLPVGLISGRVMLLTNQGEEVERIQVQVNGTVVSNMSLIGGSSFKPDSNVLTIGQLASNEGFSTKIWLVLRGEGHESMEVTIDQKHAKDALNVSLGDRKIEANRTLIPINFDVPKGAPEVYYPGAGKGTYAEVVVRADFGKSVEIPIYVKLIITK